VRAGKASRVYCTASMRRCRCVVWVLRWWIALPRTGGSELVFANNKLFTFVARHNGTGAEYLWISDKGTDKVYDAHEAILHLDWITGALSARPGDSSGPPEFQLTGVASTIWREVISKQTRQFANNENLLVFITLFEKALCICLMLIIPAARYTFTTHIQPVNSRIIQPRR